MTIKKIKACELKDFIFSEEYRNMKALPISRHRALSHIKNPRVNSEDVILILAYNEKGELAGYLGILADVITIKELEYKAGWLSCLWVDENTRGKGIAKRLLNEAFQAWKGQLLVTEFTPEAKSLYDRLGEFTDLKIVYGTRGYLRFNSCELLPPKKALFRKNRPALKVVDGFLNFFNDIRLFFWRQSIRMNDFKMEYVTEIDEEVRREILKSKSFVNRRAEDLDWIMKHPWILEAPFQDAFSRRYHFSALNKKFQFLAIKLLDKTNRTKAFLILSVKGKNLKVPYCYFNAADTDELVRLLYAHMLSMNLNMLTVYHPLLAEHIASRRGPFFYKKKIKRHYIISKKFQEEIREETVTFQDGDADCSFS